VSNEFKVGDEVDFTDIGPASSEAPYVVLAVEAALPRQTLKWSRVQELLAAGGGSYLDCSPSDYEITPPPHPQLVTVVSAADHSRDQHVVNGVYLTLLKPAPTA